MANYAEMPLSEATRNAALDRYIEIRSESGSYSVYDPNTQFSRPSVAADALEAVVQEALATIPISGMVARLKRISSEADSAHPKTPHTKSAAHPALRKETAMANENTTKYTPIVIPEFHWFEMHPEKFEGWEKFIEFTQWLRKQEIVICNLSFKEHPLAMWLGEQVSQPVPGAEHDWITESGRTLSPWEVYFLMRTLKNDYGKEILRINALLWMHQFGQTL